MYSLTIAVAISCLLAVHGLPAVSEPIPWVPGGRYGDCDNAPIEELVHIDQVHIPAKQGQVVTHTSEWHGDQLIYCVIVENQHERERRISRADLKQGGIGHHFFEVLLHSQPGQGLDFTIAVYARGRRPRVEEEKE